MTVATRIVTAALLAAASLASSAVARAEEPGPATLTLVDGGSVAGDLLESAEPAVLRWQGASFTTPFEFALPAVSSVTFPASPPAKPEGDFSFELAGGDVLSGRLRGWSDETVAVESPHFGLLSVRRAAIRRMYRIDENPALAYSGPSGLAGWSVGEAGWREDGPHLQADQEGASLTGEFEIPERAVIEFEVTWKKTPDFVLAVGVDGRSKADSPKDGWRFETWGDREKTLVAVCERRDAADVAEVATLAASTGTTASTPPGRLDVSDVDPFRGAMAQEDDGINRTYFQPKKTPGAPPPPKPPAPEKRVHLVAYLDQAAGSLKVFRPDGAPVAEVAVPPEGAGSSEAATAPAGAAQAADGSPPPPAGLGGLFNAPRRDPPKPGKIPRTVRLINRGGDLRLERLRVARWNGAPPAGGGSSRIELADGGVLTGEVVALREEAGEFVLRGTDGERAVGVRDVVALELSSGVPEERREVVATLGDGTRVSGTPGGFAAGETVVNNPDIAEPLKVPHAKARSLAFGERREKARDVDADLPKPEGRIGTLECDGLWIRGALAAATEAPGSSCLSWQPLGSRTAGPLKPGVSGRVVYREPPKPRVPVRSAANLRGGGLVQIRQMAQPAIRRPSQTLPGGPKRRQGPPHDMHLRSGDVIPCEVVAVDDTGVHIESPVAAAKVVPHASVKAVELTAGALPDVRDAKKDRLLTVPRAQKDSPPTHLLHSRNGDLLRCRLVSMSAERVRVEVQLAEIDIPRDRVARIIWFHEDEIADDSTERDSASGVPQPAAAQTQPSVAEDGIDRTHFDPRRTRESPLVPPPRTDAIVPVEAPHPPGPWLVQVLRSDGNRTTFDADEVDGGFISGTSEVIGACSFELSGIDVIAFGRSVDAAAANLPYAAWRLRPAVEPLVAQDFDPSGGDGGTASPLVGQPAPEIALDLLDGGGFRLSEQKGRIVVLDFWASWCGPCIQTMPLTEQAMAEFDPAAVRLVAVNLEEPAEQVRGVMERHKLRSPVALDIDGVAARRYRADAIPQVVVVDRDGKVARVFVGGGREAVEQLKASLHELLSAEPSAATPP